MGGTQKYTKKKILMFPKISVSSGEKKYHTSLAALSHAFPT